MIDPYEQTRELYREVATAFDANRDKTLFERRWLDKVLAHCPPAPRILYLGSGTGAPVAGYLIDQGAQITGVDFAPEMLDIARKGFPDHSWIETDVRSYQPDVPFDAVVMWSVLFHLTQDDQRALIPRLPEMVTEGGPVLLQTGIDAGEGFGTVEGRHVYHSTLDTAEYRALLTECGLTEIDYRAQDPEAGGFTVWLARSAN